MTAVDATGTTSRPGRPAQVVVLAAGRSLSRAQVATMARALSTAAGGVVEIDLFSWSPVEQGAPVRSVRSVTVLGPVAGYTPPRAGEAGPETAPPPSRRPPLAPGAGAAPRVDLPRRVVDRARRRLLRARRAPAYQRLRRLVRGGVARQLARRARRTPALATAFGAADIVVTVDATAVPAAWHLSRRIQGPVVVQGIPAAERALRPRG